MKIKRRSFLKRAVLALTLAYAGRCPGPDLEEEPEREYVGNACINTGEVWIRLADGRQIKVTNGMPCYLVQGDTGIEVFEFDAPQEIA